MSNTKTGRVEPRAAVTAGIDWANEDHAVAIVDEHGRPVDRFSVAHTAPDLRRLVTRLRRAGVVEVAIERPDGPVVDALLDAGLTVFVIAPKQMKNLRGRYGSAGNKDDRFDAYVLADVLRTDRARMRPLTRDSEQTITLRMSVRARQDLVHARVAMGNQLRAHLEITLPGAIGLFRDIDSGITLAFLRRFPSQDKADWLSQTRLANWLRSVGYNHPANARPALGQAARRAARSHRPRRRRPRPDHPRPGRGDHRAERPDPGAGGPDRRPARHPPRRGHLHLAAPHAGPSARPGCSPRSATPAAAIPTPEALTCLAGAAPSTRQSGKVKVVTFRWAVDKQLRGAVIDFAGDSWQANPWAADLYHRARARGHDHPHAARILARAWLHVIWRCWQDRVPYDPAKHGALQRVLAQAA